MTKTYPLGAPNIETFRTNKMPLFTCYLSYIFKSESTWMWNIWGMSNCSYVCLKDVCKVSWHDSNVKWSIGGCDRASDPLTNCYQSDIKLPCVIVKLHSHNMGFLMHGHWSHAWVEDAPKVLRHTSISKWIVGAVTKRLTRLTNASKC